ncbi:DEAD/DEAH box helicase [Sulfurovum sp. bin170]|uniref:DEAD/DEAH box helicase n=1 Tax=Sulfurovum sp. bin170 TaxID=2695268 RepID=UPI0013E0A997|nr:DEAD/DEAH box helicase [Sulfurovum sp. bin170]NEW61168.1 DEAD/DEAH box helicase [Sulfurovum sp. bin170]
MLEIFKQQKSFLTRAKEKSSFKYIIDFDDNGAFIEVCDNKLKPLKGVDYRVYNGLDREILQLIDECREDDFFQISWEHESEEIYLHSHPRLLELLRLSDKVFSAKDVPISFESGVLQVKLEVIREGDKFLVLPTVRDSSEFKFLTSSYILIGDRVLQVSSVGDNFERLKTFNTTIDEKKLEEFLTILVTHFENIDIVYDGYSVEEKRETKQITPAVIFEKITVENELVLRTSATVGQLSPEFFNDFNITKIVLVNDLTKIISIYECDFADVFEIYGTIFKNLNSLKRGKKELDFSEEDGLFIINQELAGKFILNHLHSIITKCELFGSEKLKAYNYNTSTPTLSVKFKDKIDFLDRGDVSVNIGEEQFDVFDLINLYRKHAYIPLQNGEKSIIDKDYMAKLERVFKKDGKDKVKVSFFDLPEIEEIIARKEQKVFSDSRGFYEGFNELKSSKKRLPKLEGVKLREYQKHGIKWMKYLYDNKFGGCLADDMGLGKTVQAITLLSYIYPKSKTPSLIVMPRSLLSNWQKEFDKFNPNLSYYCYHGTDREPKELKKHNIILTTYAIVRNDIEKLKELTFDTIILDESQNIKNLDSKISKAVMLLEGKHRFALSGTPIENSLFELYSLFRFLNAGMFSTIRDFKRDYAVPIQSDSNEAVARVLRAKISPFLLRRLKNDVLTELPAKQEQVIYVDMDDAHKRFYEEKRDYYKKILDQQIATNGINSSKFVILQAFNELRQIASAPELKSEKSIVSSKVEQLFEMLEDIVANGHKVLIFANFLGSLDLIASKAESMGIEYLMMTGSTRDREALVEKFQNDKKHSLFLMTLKVGGVGLNLTEADYVFIFDPWWNKSAENQAIDRAHRIGQKNRVFAYKMITKGTIEEKILELQMQKQDMTDMVISGDEGGLKQLSSSDLDYILG